MNKFSFSIGKKVFVLFAFVLFLAFNAEEAKAQGFLDPSQVALVQQDQASDLMEAALTVARQDLASSNPGSQAYTVASVKTCFYKSALNGISDGETVQGSLLLAKSDAASLCGTSEKKANLVKLAENLYSDTVVLLSK